MQVLKSFHKRVICAVVVGSNPTRASHSHTTIYVCNVDSALCRPLGHLTPQPLLNVIVVSPPSQGCAGGFYKSNQTKLYI